MTEISLYNFSKRKNSTKRPAGQGTSVSCLLKANTTFQNPTFVLQTPLGDMLQFNYVKWADHYYYIDSTTSINAGQTEIVCTEDVLATYKDAIGNYACFIERSAHIDPLLDDSLYLPTEEWQQTATIVGMPVGVLDNTYSGRYIMRCIGNDGVDVFFIYDENLTELLRFMYNPASIPDLLENSMTKFLFDPAKYIVDLKWVPFRLSNFLHIASTIKLGYWDSGVTASLIGSGSNSPVVKFSYDLEPSNPLYNSGDFRYYNANYSRYFAKLPCIGTVPIDITKTNKGQLSADYYFDAYSGIADVWLRSGPSNIAHYQCQMSVPVNIGGTTIDAGSALIGGLSSLSAVASGNPLGAVSGALNTAKSLLSPEVTSIGSVGSVGGILNNLDASAICYTRRSTVPNGDTEGFADGKVRRISTCSGYVQCRNASIAISGFTGDQETVNNYLNSGFYYE